MFRTGRRHCVANAATQRWQRSKPAAAFCVGAAALFYGTSEAACDGGPVLHDNELNAKFQALKAGFVQYTKNQEVKDAVAAAAAVPGTSEGGTREDAVWAAGIIAGSLTIAETASIQNPVEAAALVAGAAALGARDAGGTVEEAAWCAGLCAGGYYIAMGGTAAEAGAAAALAVEQNGLASGEETHGAVWVAGTVAAAKMNQRIGERLQAAVESGAIQSDDQIATLITGQMELAATECANAACRAAGVAPPNANPAAPNAATAGLDDSDDAAADADDGAGGFPSKGVGVASAAAGVPGVPPTSQHLWFEIFNQVLAAQQRIMQAAPGSAAATAGFAPFQSLPATVPEAQQLSAEFATDASEADRLRACWSIGHVLAHVNALTCPEAQGLAAAATAVAHQKQQQAGKRMWHSVVACPLAPPEQRGGLLGKHKVGRLLGHSRPPLQHAH